MRNDRSPSSHASAWRIAMNEVNGGSTKRRHSTCATVTATNSTGSISSLRSQRRPGRARPAPLRACIVMRPPPFRSQWWIPPSSRHYPPPPPPPLPFPPGPPRMHLQPQHAPDHLTPFLLADAGVRGVHVALRDTWAQVLARNPHPAAIRELLGEALAASALFTGHAKVDGRLSVQLGGQDALRMLFAECTVG